MHSIQLEALLVAKKALDTEVLHYGGIGGPAEESGFCKELMLLSLDASDDICNVCRLCCALTVDALLAS